MYPGEYVEGLPRATNVLCTLAGTYAGARLRREDPQFYAGSGDSDESQVYLQNLGSTSVTVQLKQCRDYSAPGNDSSSTPTGTRFDLNSPVTLVPGGKTTLQLSPWMEYLEIWGVRPDKGTIKVQITSQTRWQEMAFDKSETTITDVTLWQDKGGSS